VAAAAASQLLGQLQQGLGDALRLGGALAATLERRGGTRSDELTGSLRDRRRGRCDLISATAAAATTHQLLTALAGVAAAAATHELLTALAGVAAAATTDGRGTRRKIGGGQRSSVHLFYTSLENILRRAGEAVGLLGTRLRFNCELLSRGDCLGSQVITSSLESLFPRIQVHAGETRI
jgi:hypothetical protein